LPNRQEHEKAPVMSQYNPNLNHALVNARLRARVAEASRSRLGAESGGRRRSRRSLSSIRGFAYAIHELLKDPGVVSGRGPVGPIR
jgi:hypothetical protein